MKRYPWHVINAGGLPRLVFIEGAWFTPYFMSHDECRNWWDRYCKNRPHEQRPWAMTDIEK